MTELGVVTAERDSWRGRALRSEAALAAERESRAALMRELASYVVAALREAKFVQINPDGVPTDGR